MTTKYIVDNVANQTISGNITINGNLSVTGVTTGNLATYKALLTDIGSQTGTTLNDIGGLNGGFIIGETYTITTYVSGDSFSNIANIQGGRIITFDSIWTIPQSNSSYPGLTGTTNGSGNGATFDVSTDGLGGGSLSIDSIGTDYAINDTITILGTDIGGITPDNDILITITDSTPFIIETGCVFIATGELPTNWNNGSTLVSSGNLVVTVLENNLGFDIEWIEDFTGVYAGFNSTTGPLYNTFNRNSTFLLGGNQTPFFGPNPIETFIFPNNFNEKDDSIILFVVDLSVPEPVDNSLYYYSIEIQILQDLDTTPTVISGTTTSFPFTNVSVEFYCGDMFIQSFYTSGGTIVNNISEVVTILNTDTNTSFLGTFSDDGGNIILTMATNLETQFCANSTLTFYVFND